MMKINSKLQIENIEKLSTPKMLKLVDETFNELSDLLVDYELKYNKFYIGVAKNIVEFNPKKHYMYFKVNRVEIQEKIDKIENAGLEVTFSSQWN